MADAPVVGRGLSPRVRGNLAGVAEEVAVQGSIPACAGEPPWMRRRAMRCGVYPRVCGGTRYEPGDADVVLGLSPRVRGNPALADAVQSGAGSIPACAGEPRPGVPGYRAGRVYPRVCGGTWKIAPSLRLLEVYPRVCGGTGRRRRRRSAPYGLSPRVRGNQSGSAPGAGWQRSIPACAGEPGVVGMVQQHWGVYPRVCGGTSVCGWRRRPSEGLSPRVRGNLQQLPDGLLCRRSIPACAGEPQLIAEWAGGVAVYPRVCGGTGNAGLLAHIGRGLSPRVRGNRQCRPVGAHRPRSIPACAGEPSICRTGPRPVWVYPRVCGGTLGRGMMPL